MTTNQRERKLLLRELLVLSKEEILTRIIADVEIHEDITLGALTSMGQDELIDFYILGGFVSNSNKEA